MLSDLETHYPEDTLIRELTVTESRAYLALKAGYSHFFSSRRRHTRSHGDWSSDLCSSDLIFSTPGLSLDDFGMLRSCDSRASATKRSEERRVGKSVDLGGRRIIKNKS